MEIKPRDRDRGDRPDRGERSERGDRDRGPRKPRNITKEAMPLKDNPSIEMKRYLLKVGYRDGVKPGNIVGAIANEADLDSRMIGHIEIFEDFATVDLPADMNKQAVSKLAKTRICGQRCDITNLEEADDKVFERERPAGGNRRRQSNDRGDRGGERRPRNFNKDRGDRSDRGDRKPRPRNKD